MHFPGRTGNIGLDFPQDRLPGPMLLDCGLLLASWGPESSRSPSARDRGHPLCGFWGVETEATGLLSVPKTEASLGQLWVRS